MGGRRARAGPASHDRVNRPQAQAGLVGLTLDAGALIALDRGDPKIRALLRQVSANGGAVFVPAGALAQAWRDGRRQARVAAFLRSAGPVVIPLNERMARASGELCARAGTSDIVDASVVLCARINRHRVATSDPNDLARLDPQARLVPV